MTPAPKLELSTLEPFAVGGHRTCYVHPLDESRCVKVLHEPWKEIGRRAKDPFRLLRRRFNYDENRAELRELNRLEKKLGSSLPEHFPRCYGLVDTDLGEGLVVDLIRDQTGEVSQTLRNYIRHSGYDTSCLKAINEYWAFLNERLVLVRDPFPRNLVIRFGENGEVRVFQIDGFGASDFLPFSRIIPRLTRKKLDGRRRKFDAIAEKHSKVNDQSVSQDSRE